MGLALALFEGLMYPNEFTSVPSILFGWQMSNVIQYGSGQVFRFKDYRWSIFNGLQFDRELVVKFSANRGNLIKALPKPDKA